MYMGFNDYLLSLLSVALLLVFVRADKKYRLRTGEFRFYHQCVTYTENRFSTNAKVHELDGGKFMARVSGIGRGDPGITSYIEFYTNDNAVIVRTGFLDNSLAFTLYDKIIDGPYKEAYNNSMSATSIADEPKSATSIADEIQKLANLRDNGILTEQEFQTAKRKFIG